MDFLLDPNIAYLLLAGSLIFAVLAVLNPGTGLIEILALFGLLLAGGAVSNLQINSWALIVLFVGAILFIASARKARKTILLILSILALILGSVFLFRGDTWWQPVVDPWLAAVVSILSGGFFWLLARKLLEAERITPVHSLENLIGKMARARSDINNEGSVQISESWRLQRRTYPEGMRVRVRAEGFVYVEQ